MCVRHFISHTAHTSGPQQPRPAGRAELWVPARGPGLRPPVGVEWILGTTFPSPHWPWFPAPNGLCPGKHAALENMTDCTNLCLNSSCKPALRFLPPILHVQTSLRLPRESAFDGKRRWLSSLKRGVGIILCSPLWYDPKCTAATQLPLCRVRSGGTSLPLAER